MIAQNPYIQQIEAVTGKTSTFTTDFTCPLLEDYTFLIKVANTGGTSMTLNVVIQIALDGNAGATPTTFFGVAQFAQINSNSSRKLLVFPIPVGGAASPVADLTKLESAVDTTNLVVSGFAPMTKQLRINHVIGGTSPSFDITMWVVGNERQKGGY